MDHIIESQQFNPKLLYHIFREAQAFKKGLDNKKQRGAYQNILRGRVMATLFYEPSTRTRFSFESAMARLGGHILSTENAGEFSSAAKGETLEDTIRITNGYADVIVLRHKETGAAKRAAAVSTVPIINAGDGIGQHPTQALLDTFTLYDTFGTLNDLHIAMVGDLKHGRTVRSLAYLLGKFTGNTIHFVAPPAVKMEEDILAYLNRHSVEYHETEDLSSVLPNVDAVYMTRVQKERFESPKEYEQIQGVYRITPRSMNLLPRKSILLHPLPRIGEIDPAVDDDPRAKYFEQAANGLYVRMALLKLVLTSF